VRYRLVANRLIYTQEVHSVPTSQKFQRCVFYFTDITCYGQHYKCSMHRRKLAKATQTIEYVTMRRMCDVCLQLHINLAGFLFINKKLCFVKEKLVYLFEFGKRWRENSKHQNKTKKTKKNCACTDTHSVGPIGASNLAIFFELVRESTLAITFVDSAYFAVDTLFLSYLFCDLVCLKVHTCKCAVFFKF
jgi:hypothetical protein